MKDNKTTLSVRVNDEEYEILTTAAKLDERGIGDYIRRSALIIAKQFIKEYEKENQPMEEIEVKTMKRDYETEGIPFIKIPWAEVEKAFKSLSYPAFGIYLYTQEKDAPLTYEAVSEHCPMAKEVYTRSIQELTRKGYLD